jgi:hypothetical protein
MRYDEMSINLSADKAKRLNGVQKPIDSTFLYSDITWGFECSEGDRPADPFLPNRYAPTVRVLKKVTLQEKGVVIPRGTIISALPVMNQNYYWRTASTTVVPGSGQTLSGQLALGIGYDGNALLADVEDMIEGYDNIRLAAEIANGGVIAKDKYIAHDVTRGRVNSAGVLVTTNDTFSRVANIPIGFTTEDTFMWDAGNKLNFNEISWTPFRSYATDYFVEMPYCADVSTYAMTIAFSSGAQTMGAGYAAAHALGMPFLTAATTLNTSNQNGGSLADMLIGTFIAPDANGKFRVQYAAATAVGAAGYKTAQTVGKLASFTNKFPADLEGLVETFHTTKTGGTATYGIQYNLFVFLRAILLAVIGSEPTYADYRDALDSGKFGIARINLHVA